jgi:predicted nucleic acid-binding protein
VGRLPVVEMIVLDANILIRAVLGRQVRQLLETYAGHGIRFYAPEIAYAEAAKYLPPLLRKKGKSDADLPATFAYLQSLVQPILQDSYGLFEEEARQRLRGRDEEDWPVLAAALALSSSDLDRGHGLLRRRNRGLEFRPHRDLSKRAAEIPRSGRNLGAFPAFVVV